MSFKQQGSVSGVDADVGATSLAVYSELRDALGNPLPVVKGGVSDNTTRGLLQMGTDSGYVRPVRILSTGSAYDGRTPLFWDPVEGAAVNTQLWTQSLTTQTMTQANGVILFNASAITTINTASIITSTKQFPKLPGITLLFRTRAKMNYLANTCMEFGFGAPTTFTPAIANGAFFRRNVVGELRAVVSNGSVETESAPLATLDSSTYYTFAITFDEDSAHFYVQAPGAAPVVDMYLSIPASQGSEIAVSHIPCFARQYHHTSAPSAGTTNLNLTDVTVFALDSVLCQPFSHMMASMQKSLLSNPFTTFAQLTTDSNSAIAAAITPTNTAAGLATLGGRWQMAAPAGAETDLCHTAYLNVTPYQMFVTDVQISTANVGAAVATTGTLLEWSIGAQSTAVSLATASPPMHRVNLGFQTFPVAAPIGAVATDIIRSFQTPIVVDPGRYLHLILRVPIGTATASQVLRGKTSFGGYFV